MPSLVFAALWPLGEANVAARTPPRATALGHEFGVRAELSIPSRLGSPCQFWGLVNMNRGLGRAPGLVAERARWSGIKLQVFLGAAGGGARAAARG